MSENIITAIIAGSVSLIISGIAGIYNVVQNKKRFDDLKKELITKSKTEDFITARIKFLDDYREFHSILVQKLNTNPEDKTKASQALIDFFAEKAKDYYMRNRSFLKSNELENLLTKINTLFNSKTLNNKESNERSDLATKLLSFVKKLNDQSLK
ncbi:hypothetical protein [uncultured Winogradskyella sp.]|uniref:hypothetical protein n=1 Tax=uncultured Winogradskyella sp. TaxID=395353 RepID=UPI0030EE0E45|tara:strand:+ start:3725 stop:4189 length:465 start_codon:yes stop_codon:yes gene_type:complete